MRMSHDELAAGGELQSNRFNRHDESQANGTILVVDDEPGVRRLCKLILERCGYEVVEADCAEAAKAIWKEQHQSIDMLLTDYNMPGETGVQLCEWLRSENANLPMILMSGSVLRDFEIPPLIPYLQKPFSMQNLIAVVQSRLQHV